MEDKVKAVLEGLNEEQRMAVECVDGPVLIVAGAGSGKTRVLTSRIAYILAGGTEASRVLALTFTKKAAGEMKSRIADMVGERTARKLVMGTFHSVFVRFLREYAASLGYPERFTIYDTSDSTSAVKACIKELGLDDKIYKPKDVLSRISMAKNNLVTVQGYRNNAELMVTDSHSRRPRMCDIYELYQKKLKTAGVMDFDDILLNMNYLLRDNKDALIAMADRFSYIMVDEYQDTNYAQYLILKKLAQFHHNICVVGDDSQSIYAFRGAKIENILNFKKDYPECRVFRLERNYRSTSTIVDAANSIIEHNDGRIPKKCYAVGGTGEKIKLLKTYTEQDEAVSIVSEIIARMRREQCGYKDFAILYRTNSQSRALEEQLRRRNIPYMIYSGNSFFDRAEVKDMMAYFKLVVNPSDDESFRRVVNKPARGIGDTTFRLVESAAAASGTPLFEAALKVAKVVPFCTMIKGLSELVSTTDAHELAIMVAEKSGLYASYKADTSIEGLSRVANLDELLNSVSSFIEEREMEAEGSDEPLGTVTLDDFLENVSLLSNVDVSEGDEDNKVALMTVHSAKGLEFPYVFVAGMEENLFPSLSMLATKQNLEEERRLFYVAVTRAGRALSLSFAGTRMRNGKHESNSPSRFIREIDSSYIENPLDEADFDDSGVRHEWGGFGSRFTGGRLDRMSGSTPGDYGKSSRVTYERGARQGAPSPAVSRVAPPVRRPLPEADPDFVGVDMRQLRVGERVEHNRFGAGTILNLSGTAPDMKAHIKFDLHGEKLLLLKYAKIRPLKV